jgi:hypothetical protein
VEKVGDDAAQVKSEDGAVSPAGRVGQQKGSRRRGESESRRGQRFCSFPLVPRNDDGTPVVLSPFFFFQF